MLPGWLAYYMLNWMRSYNHELVMQFWIQLFFFFNLCLSWVRGSRNCQWTANDILTVSVSSGSCMVMQSILIWMVFPADPSVGLSVKFNSMGWTEWMADLKHKGRVMLKNSDQHIFSKSPQFIVACKELIFVVVVTYWSSISNSWLNTSWLKESVVCADWFWDMVVRNELSLQDKRDEGSLSLQGDNSNHDDIHLLLIFQISNMYFTVGIFEKGTTILIGLKV